MKRTFGKSLITGITVGLMLFIIPFLLIKALFFLLIIIAGLAFFGKRKFRQRHRQNGFYSEYSQHATDLYDDNDSEFYGNAYQNRNAGQQIIYIDIQ